MVGEVEKMVRKLRKWWGKLRKWWWGVFVKLVFYLL
jgi:hypothetical protein